MKVFISHKNTDSTQALLLKRAFELQGVSAYLDVLDDSINGGGKELTEHIKKQLMQCTDMIVLITESTKSSWWVPFEIGMSAQVNMPTASFLRETITLPSYLSYWPRLKNVNDISKYVSVRKQTGIEIRARFSAFERYSSNIKQELETELFYENLKKEMR